MTRPSTRGGLLQLDDQAFANLGLTQPLTGPIVGPDQLLLLKGDRAPFA